MERFAWIVADVNQLFLGVGKNSRLLIQSCRFFVFFSLDLFMKISNFSKTVHTIFIKFCSHSTPKGAPACSKASKLYDWNLRNIAKISPKMAKISPKLAIFRLFSISSKTVHTIFYSHSSSYQRPICAMASKLYGWDVRNIAKISPKMAKKQLFFDFFQFSQKLSIRFERNFLQLFYT